MPRPTALRARASGPARAAAVALDGRRVVLVDISSDVRLGALTSAASATITAAAEAALAERLPLVLEIASSGADITEGIAALHGWGQAARAIAACSGVVPVIAVVDGPAVSGPALMLGIADIVVMTEQSYAFVSGPSMVAEFTGEVIDNDELGGPVAHARQTGLAALVVADRAGAIDEVSRILAYLPDHCDQEPPRWATDDPPGRPTPEAGEIIPPSPTGSYDVRGVITALVDDGELLELRARWAANVVTALPAIRCTRG